MVFNWCQQLHPLAPQQSYVNQKVETTETGIGLETILPNTEQM